MTDGAMQVAVAVVVIVLGAATGEWLGACGIGLVVAMVLGLFSHNGVT